MQQWFKVLMPPPRIWIQKLISWVEHGDVYLAGAIYGIKVPSLGLDVTYLLPWVGT